jgi:hypothetical protein
VKYRGGRRIFSAEEGDESTIWAERLWKKIRIKIEDLVISFFTFAVNGIKAEART